MLVLGPLLLLLLFLGPPWGWALLIALSSAQASFELLSMTHRDDRLSRLFGALVAFLVSCAVSFGGGDPRLFLTAVILALVFSALLPLWRLGDLSSAALRTLGGMAGPLYVAVLLSTLSLIRLESDGVGPHLVFLTLTLAWMGDTGGYTFGRLFGKTPLYPAVSPKKTREGLLGSVVFSTASGVLASFTYLPELPLLGGVVLGAAGALLGQAGDLMESLLKRSSGTKDSGSILPGHGGLLDRIDALLVVSPMVYLYTIWFL